MNVIAERLAARAPLVQLANESDKEAALAPIAGDVNMLVATSHLPPLDAAYLSRFPKLQLISSFGVGYDHIDAAWAGAHGVIVTHTPGVLDAEVADTAMALTLMTVSRLPQAERYLREGRWANAPFPLSAVAPWPHNGDSRPRAHRARDRAPRRRLRPRHRLPRTQGSTRRALSLLSRR